MPPVVVISILPLVLAAQVGLTVATVALSAEAGCAIVAVAVVVQPLLSVTVIWYVPAVTLLRLAVV